MTAGRRKTREELIDELQRLAGELGETPTVRDMKEHGRYSYNPYRDRFDSWRDALKAAGLETDRTEPPSREDLIEGIHRLADEVDGTPRKRDLDELGEYSYHRYRDEFGGWTDAVKAAGFEPNLNTDITNEDLLAEIRDLADRLGRVPRSPDMTDYGAFARCVYYDRFGSWNDAVRAAGLEPVREHGIPEDSLLAEIHRLADGDEPPTIETMRRFGKYSTEPYANRFGSWTEAVREAGYEPHIEPDRDREDRGRDTDPDEKYDSEWSRISRRVRRRDGRCVHCGIGPVELDRRDNDSLQAHHVEHDKNEKDPVVEISGMRPARHVALCPDCHAFWDWVNLGPDVRVPLIDLEEVKREGRGTEGAEDPAAADD